MKKCLLFLVCFVSLNCFAQNHKAQIDQFRKGYMADFLTDASSPLKKDDLQYLRFYDADSTYRVTATVTLLTNADAFVMPTFKGPGSKHQRYALLNFTLKGKAMQLTVYKNVALANMPQYKDYLFLPFTDDTNGKTTYAGGRYIDLREGDIINATFVLDFNKAYNPYCAFAAGYACPVPPAENKLTFSIEAGEKLFGREVKH